MPFRLLLLLSFLTLPLGAQEAQSVAATGGTEFLSDAEWNQSKTPAQKTSEHASPGMAIVQLMAALAVVLGLAVGGALFLKKIGVRRILPGRGRHLEVIETVPLAFKRAVSLVKLGEHVLVIGQGEHELTHIATFPAASVTSLQAEVVKASEEKVEPVSVDRGFRATLEHLLGKKR